MKTAITSFLVLFLLSAAASADAIKQVDQPQGIPSFLGYASDKLIVVVNPDVGELSVQRGANGVMHVGDKVFDDISDRFAVSGIRRQFPGSELKSAELARYYKVRFDAGTLEDALKAYSEHPMVEHVEPIGIHSMYATPNDFYFSYQWHLDQTSDHDIDAPEAWDIEAGADATVVAILDSGTRYYHPDLGGVNASPSNPGASRGNMWINTTELNGSSGYDDDGNGYTDDWIGYDFIDGVSNCWTGEDCNTKDNDPRDFNGHGTHTSGIFGMITNDGYGMCGVAGGWGNGSQAEWGNGVRIMPLRMGYSYNYLGQEYGVVMMDAAAEAFYYAADNGADIASCSWGSSNSGGIGAAATYFLNSGGLIFVAAGNDGSQTADYLNGRGDCISVSATDQNDNGASFTTYGTWVDICAPGVGIYSTFHDHTDPNTNYWAGMDGTSMATPMAAGVAALIWSQNPSWTASQVENQLYSSADNIDAYLSSQYIGKMGAGRINAYNAVNTGPPPPPVADFYGTPTSGTEPLTVNFTDQSTGSITSWAWDFGDGVGTSSAQNPSYEYTSAGSYTVTLTVTGPGGSDDEIKVGYITVNPCVPPTADFTGSPTLGDAPLTVDFTDWSTGATSWLWNFGDTQTSTAQNPSHTYTSAGFYTVTLTATNACGSDDEIKVNYIEVTEPTVDYATPPYSTGFESGSFDSYWFTQSDNSEGRIQITSANSPRGSYHLTMDDNYDGGLYAQNEAWLRLNLAGNSNVELSFWWKEFSDEDHTQDGVFFSDNGGSSFTKVYNLTGGTTTYQEIILDVDALASANGLSLTGTFVVKFQQYDNYGITTDGMAFDDISVTSLDVPPVADFVGSPTSGNYPLTVNFTDQSTGNPTSWSWDFGDGVGTSTAQNPSYEYTSAGTYTVTLTATNAFGSDDEIKVDYITVTSPPPPTAAFVGNPTSGVAPLTVNFTDQSTGNPTSWSWDFGDGVGTSTAQNPSYEYTSAGTYTVSLTATNAYGSDDEVKVDYITVTEPGGDYANLPYSTGFETGSFDQYWFTQSDNSEGRILITSANSPRGSYHMTMDDNYNGGLYAQNEAWLKVNLAGKSDVELTFWWKEFSDEDHTQDGVFFSDNGGSSFTKVYNLTGGSSTYQEIVLDVDALAGSYGLSLTGTFVIKFQQYDNYSITTDGMAFDDISVISLEAPPVADFSGSPTSGVAPLTVNFTDLSSGNPTSWSWTFGDGGTSTQQNPTYQYDNPGTYTVTLTATNAYGSDGETKTDYITVNPPGAWTTITYDDFESGFGNYTDGGGDCYWYTGYTYAWEGSCAADIQDNSGVASSFYHTVGYNVTGYNEMEVEFYFIAISMEAGEDFWVQYYDGSTWYTVASFARGVDFNNSTWYVVTVTISDSQYNFPTNARLRFMCDASGNADDVYIDAITWRGMSGTSSFSRPTIFAKGAPIVPDEFSLSQNHPNPFNPATEFSFSLPTATDVRIEIFNVLGQCVEVLVDRPYDAGEHTVTWDAGDQPSGVYFYRIQTDDFVETKKMLLLK